MTEPVASRAKRPVLSRVAGPVLITGGAGSVGVRLTERFLEEGLSVRAFDLPMMDFSALEGRPGVDIVKGDVTDLDGVLAATDGVSATVHLAALLPPNSERDRDRTFDVNVGGTETVVEALERGGGDATLVFPSSISTYGDTYSEGPPIGVDHSQSAIDVYADSKIAAERTVISSALKSVVLRIAGIAVPAFLEPPDVWPFMCDQRVEMVHRDDVVDALYASAVTPAAAGKIYNIAGGPTWQRLGRDYVSDFYEFVGAPADDAVYRDSPGWMDWYDTEESHRVLKYQNRAYHHYAGEMRAMVEAMMAE